MTVQEWLGEDNKLGIDIWEKKYRYEDETFDEWLDRVSGGHEDVKRLILEHKFLFGGRILANRGLDNKGKKISYSNCFSYNTEIVTKNGIKQIGDLVGKDIKVLSYGKWRDATVRNFGTQKLVALHLRKNKAKKTIYVTEDHVWYVSGQSKFVKKKTIELRPGDQIPVDVLKCYRSYKPSPFGVAHGAFYGDGDHSGTSRRMNFCGDKKELIDYFTPDTVGSSKDTLTICGIPKIFWNKPSLDETPSYLYGWLAGYFATDGAIDERGSCILTSSKREDLEFAQDVLAVLGIPCEEIRVQNRLSNLTNTYSNIYILTLNKAYLNESFFVIKKDRDRFINNPPIKNGTWKVVNVDTEDNKIDQVYCVVEPEKHSFTLKGNILTHNCYVLTVDDSIESIFDCAKKIARTYSYGGGCGVDISKLSPRGAKINNAAKETSGAVSFMDLYSLVTELIGQSGRRGALMISISCEHPDLEEFINVKSDLDRVTKANISIRITDKFMEAVKNKEKFTLSFTREETGETITKEIDAYEFFHKICEMNWDYAEPGMLFWDRIENWNLLSADDNFHYAGVNPCFAGNMKLLTTDGYKTFEELCDTEPYIYNVNGNITKSKVWCSGEKETVKVKFYNDEIICTPDHRFMTIDGDECMAKDAKGKYIMPCTNANKIFDNLYVKLGFIQGDGQLSRINSDTHEGIEVNIGQKDTDIYDLFSDEKFTKSSDRAIYVSGFKNLLMNLGFSSENLPDRVFPSTYNSWNKLQKASFLHGCYSANGSVIKSVIKNGRIAYKTTCRKFAEQLAETLYKDFGIDGVYITTNKTHNVVFSNGKYTCRESYDVNIGRYKEITKFIAEINFYQQYKREQLSQMMRRKAKMVIGVEPYITQKVYDFSEPERHWGIVEGYVVHNCAEEPLGPMEACLLSSINLAEFVTDKQTFDFNKFRKTVSIAVRATNEVLDEGIPLHPLQEQRNMAKQWRKIGVGIMGLADCLIKLGIRYGSHEAINICDLIGSAMADEALKTSALLAKEQYGPYPNYDYDAIKKSDFFTEHASQETRDLVSCYGLRNSQILCVAPTGSISTMIGVSGGIEPIYANSYQRKTESLHGHDEYYKVYTPIVQKYMEEHGLTDESELPTYFVTASDLDFHDRIYMQSVWQKHIDASISSTVNVPNDFTVEDTEKLYMFAWENGLKGVTIYRDGCKRSGILSTNDKKETVSEVDVKENDNVTTSNTLPRGYIIKVDNNTIGKERHLQTGCGSLHVCGFFDPVSGDLLTDYISKGSQGGCLSNLIGLSRLISYAARSGCDIRGIADQLLSVPACPSYVARTVTKHDTSKGACCPNAIGYALLDMYEEMQDELGFTEEQDEETSDETQLIEPVIGKGSQPKCPECGSILIFEGGCNVCKNCGWSKCD